VRKRSLIDFVASSYMLLTFLLVITSVKIYYALSRPLFESGPDAFVYIPAIRDFGQKEFFSSDIFGQPAYPPGYAFFLSISSRFLENWVPVAQVMQIVLFSFASWVFYKLVKNSFGGLYGLIAFFLISFSPAWIVANGEAMYESVYVAFAVFSLYFLLKASNSITHHRFLFYQFIGGLLLGYLVVVHPRAMLFVIAYLIYLYLSKSVTFQDFSFSLLGFLIPYILFNLRNLIAEGLFTLSGNLWPSLTFNEFLSGCDQVSCVFQRAINDPISFLGQVFSNILHYWSPYSGPLERATWFHNISGLAFLGREFGNSILSPAGLLTIFMCSLLFLSWVFGSIKLRHVNKNVNILFVMIVLGTILNDALVYGDSRHRLVAMPFMLPAYVATSVHFFTFIKNCLSVSHGLRR
jgi:hypothetical protein